MSETKFVYVTYISSTVDKVWNALLDGEMTKQYWRHENVSDWKPGSKWEHRRSDGTNIVDMTGEVVEFVPPNRLIMTWVKPTDMTDKSRVTIELETVEDLVRLTVTHDQLKPDSEMLRGISNGWPRVLSSLKSLLETGRPTNTWAGMNKS